MGPHNITTNILKMMPYTCLLLVPDVATQVQGIIFITVVMLASHQNMIYNKYKYKILLK